MKNVCIIPARGGSKRIPDKNIRPFCGRPVIEYSICAARNSGLFDRVIVSTDSPRIGEYAQKAGAEVPFVRPSELSDDYAVTDAVFTHALRWLESSDCPASFACCLYATAPFVRADDLARGFRALRDASATAAFAVTCFEFPVFRALKVNDAGRLEMYWPEHRLTRSQDLPQALHDAGQFYWVDVPQYLATGRIYNDNAVAVMMPSHRVQDIDTPEDWRRAELMFQAQDTLVQNSISLVE